MARVTKNLPDYKDKIVFMYTKDDASIKEIALTIGVGYQRMKDYIYQDLGLTRKRKKRPHDKVGYRQNKVITLKAIGWANEKCKQCYYAEDRTTRFCTCNYIGIEGHMRPDRQGGETCQQFIPVEEGKEMKKCKN